MPYVISRTGRHYNVIPLQRNLDLQLHQHSFGILQISRSQCGTINLGGFVARGEGEGIIVCKRASIQHKTFLCRLQRKQSKRPREMSIKVKNILALFMDVVLMGHTRRNTQSPQAWYLLPPYSKCNPMLFAFNAAS
jgi:hypothetical protein